MGLEELIRKKLFEMLSKQEVIPFSNKAFPLLKESADRHAAELKAKNGTG